METARNGSNPRFVRVAENDLDGDGMPDVWEHLHGRWLYPANGLNLRVNDASGDPDQDALVNLQEYANSLHPLISDTDGNGVLDGAQVGGGGGGSSGGGNNPPGGGGNNPPGGGGNNPPGGGGNNDPDDDDDDDEPGDEEQTPEGLPFVVFTSHREKQMTFQGVKSPEFPWTTSGTGSYTETWMKIDPSPPTLPPQAADDGFNADADKEDLKYETVDPRDQFPPQQAYTNWLPANSDEPGAVNFIGYDEPSSYISGPHFADSWSETGHYDASNHYRGSYQSKTEQWNQRKEFDPVLGQSLLAGVPYHRSGGADTNGWQGRGFNGIGSYAAGSSWTAGESGMTYTYKDDEGNDISGTAPVETENASMSAKQVRLECNEDIEPSATEENRRRVERTFLVMKTTSGLGQSEIEPVVESVGTITLVITSGKISSSQVVGGTLPPEVTVNQGVVTLGPVVPIEGKRIVVDLMPVEFKKMWETKNKANQIFNPTKKDDPTSMPSPAPDAAGSVHGVDSNDLFVVVDPSDDKLAITLDVEVGGDRTKIVAAAFANGSKASGSDTLFPASGPLDMRLDVADELVIRIGYDANGNHLLDTSEEIKLSTPVKFDKSTMGEPTVKGISSSKHSTMSTAASGVIALGYSIPHSAEFLRLFRDGSTTGMPADKKPTSTTSFTMNVFSGELSEWITHNAGAAFNDEGIADISFHHWDETTSAAEMAGLSYTVETAVKNHFDTKIMPQVTTHFASLAPGATSDFPQSGVATITHPHESTPSWVPKTTVSFDDPWLYNTGLDDAFGVIGRGRVPAHQVKYTVKKVEYDQYVGDDALGGPIFRKAIGYDVTARTVGSVGDLYDFNYNAGGVSEIGATLQLGYGKGLYGRTSGRIYRWDISWDETIDWFKQ